MKDGWQIIEKTATGIAEKIHDISFFRSVLNGTCANPAYAHVDKKQVENRLKWTQESLLEEINGIRNGKLNEALEEIEKMYCLEIQEEI